VTLERNLAASLHALGIDDASAVGVACSGGADSIALLHLLARIGGREIMALHVDHALRPDSHVDAGFVAEVARSLGVESLSKRTRVDAGPRESLEAVARDARYEALAQLASAAGVRFVVTAHTLDDQAETVLLRAMRGGSLDAIAPVRGPFYRPLLGVRRADLRDWLVRNSIAWREDPTNTETRFERNWVRQVLMPQLRERRAGVDASLARLASNQRDDRAVLDSLAQEVFERARIDDIGVHIDLSDIEGSPAAIASRVIRAALRHLGAEAGAEDVARARRLRHGRHRIGEVDVWRLPTGLGFLPARLQAPPPVALPLEGTVTDHDRGLRIHVSATPDPSWRWRTSIEGSVAGLLIRSRRDGDRVRRPGGSKKVSDVLIDAKVPAPLRDLVGIVAIDGDAHAVIGQGSREATSRSGTVVHVEPLGGSWARELTWASG
jgi:tRNA(Ile)-lysidine synthase